MRDRLDRSGGRNTGFQTRGAQQGFEGHGGAHTPSHAENASHNRRSGSHNTGATGSAQTPSKFEEKPAGDQSWLFEGGDDALMGSLDDVAGRFGITTDDSPSGVPGSTFESYEHHPRSSSHHTSQQPASRASTEDSWRKRDAPLPRASAASGSAAASRTNALNTSEELMKPRSARHTIQPTSAAPAAIPRAVSPANVSVSSPSPTTATATLDALWWYLDSKNLVQGPFSGSKMNSWLNYFTPDLLIGNSPTGPWSPLADRVVAGINPFDGLALATSSHNDFKTKLSEYRHRHAGLHSNSTPQKAPQSQITHQAPHTPQQGTQAAIHHEPQNLFQTAPPASSAHNQHATHLHQHAQPQHGQPQSIMHLLGPQPHATAVPATATPVKGNSLRLDDLFGSAGNLGGANVMPGQVPANAIWAPISAQPPQATSVLPSFRQIQEQEAMARAAVLATAPATGGQHFAPVQAAPVHAMTAVAAPDRAVQHPAPQAPAANAHATTQPQSKVADPHSLFAMHFGSGSTAAPVSGPVDTSRTAPTQHTQTAKASPVVSAPARSEPASLNAPTPVVIAGPGSHTTSTAKTSVNDLFDSARAGRSVPPVVVVPKGPGMYEIQQEELRRAAEEKAAEAKRKEEAKKSLEAQRGMWAEPAPKVVASAPAPSASTKGKSMREIQEEQERELSAQRQRQAEQRAAAAAAPVRAPIFNGAWGSGSSGAAKSLKQIQEEEAQANAARHAAAAEARPVATTPVAKKSSWAATVSPTASSLRQISAEQAQAPQSATSAPKSPAKPVASADDGDSFWDYPAEKEAPQAAPKVPVGGVPKAGAKKKGQKKVLNI